MNNAQLLNKIEMLPSTLQSQVNDFVDFLLNRHFQGKTKPHDPELTAEEMAELERRYQEYINDPESAVPFEVLKTRLSKKYGLQHQG